MTGQPSAHPFARSRRAFLKATLGGSAVLLLAACQQQPAAAPTAAPAAKPTEAPKPAAPAAAKPTEAAKPAAAPAKPTQAAKPAAAATTAPAAGKPGGGVLKLGVLLPYTKVYADLGEAITNGMQLYFDSVGGTAGGRRIEMIKEDEENDLAASQRKMRKLVEQDQVDLGTGVVATPVIYGLRDYLHENKVIFLCSNAGGVALTRQQKSPYIFRTSFSNQQPTAPMGEWTFKNQAKRVVTCAADYGAGREAMAAFADSFKKAGGQVLAEVWPPFPNNDYAPFLEQIRQARPEAVFSFFSGSDAVAFVKQFDEFGLKKDIKLMGSGFMLEEDVFPAQGLSAVGGITGLHYATTLDNAENKKFSEDYRAKFGKESNVFAVQGWDTARTLVDALNKRQGNTQDKDALIKALEETSFNSPRGPFRMDPATHNPIMNIYVRETRNQNGKPTNFVIETFKDVKDPAPA